MQCGSRVSGCKDKQRRLTAVNSEVNNSLVRRSNESTADPPRRRRYHDHTVPIIKNMVNSL